MDKMRRGTTTSSHQAAVAAACRMTIIRIIRELATSSKMLRIMAQEIVHRVIII